MKYIDELSAEQLSGRGTSRSEPTPIPRPSMTLAIATVSVHLLFVRSTLTIIRAGR
jgi:hypothetical protein